MLILGPVGAGSGPDEEEKAMVSLLDELKNGARILQRQAQSKEPKALERLRALPELSALDDDALSAAVLRRHTLAVVARELGFGGWPQASAVLAPKGAEGEAADDFGTLLCPPGMSAHSNIWSAHYDEAKRLREETGGYLLAYRKHFFIVDRHYVEALGLDPDDPDWQRLGRDWARPTDPEARERLYTRLIRERAPQVLAPA